MTNTMRAISLGDPDGLVEITTARPTPLPTEVLVKVHAAGVNPTDWKSRRTGGLKLWNDPPILGFDVAGVVEEIGFGVTLFRPGDAVFGMPWFPRQAGAYAEYVTAPSRHFARMPAGLPFTAAAALPLVSLTAWQALVDTAGVRPGQRVLIHAAAGGVGHVAAQIAKARGAYVLGTARAAKHEFLRGIGVDEPIDYTAVDFASAARDVDVVLDTIGGDYAERSLRVLRPGGTYLSIVAGIDDGLSAAASARGLRAAFVLVEPDHGALTEIAALVGRGDLTATVDAVFPLGDAARAHELGASNRTTGKLVLDVLTGR